MTTSRQPSEAYPRSGMCECVRFQFNYLCTFYGELRVGFNFIQVLSCIAVNNYAESNLQKVNLRYYKASGIYIAKNITLEKINCGKIKKAIKRVLITLLHPRSKYINMIKNYESKIITRARKIESESFLGF